MKTGAEITLGEKENAFHWTFATFVTHLSPVKLTFSCFYGFFVFPNPFGVRPSFLFPRLCSIVSLFKLSFVYSAAQLEVEVSSTIYLERQFALALTACLFHMTLESHFASQLSQRTLTSRTKRGRT